VEGRVEQAVGRGEIEHLQIGAHCIGRQRGRHRRDRVRDVTHVNEDEHSGHLCAHTGQGRSEAFDGRAGGDRVVYEQYPAPRHVRPSDRWFVDLVTAIPRLADERERQLCGQRYRRGQRHTGGLGADNDPDADVSREPSASRPEIPQQLVIGVGALHRERMDRSSGVIPASGAGSDQPGSRRDASGEQFVHTRHWCGVIALGPGVNGLSEDGCGGGVLRVHWLPSVSRAGGT
jgi:hypothetical protein